MKPLPPSQVIAEYRAAYERLGKRAPDLTYERGWFYEWSDNSDGIFNRDFVRFRGAQIIHMTATLNERAKAKG